MTKNKLWTFGCSFVQGGGLDGPHYPDVSGSLDWYDWKYQKTIWPKYLADLLGLDLINKGYSGSSIMCAYQMLTECLPDIREGDTIVFERTSDGRWPINTDWWKDNSDTAMGHLIMNASGPQVKYILEEDKSDIDRVDWTSWYAIRSDRQLAALVDYYLYYINDKTVRKDDGTLATSNEADYSKHTRLVSRIFEHLRGLGVNCYSWDWTLWHYGQTGKYGVEGSIDGDGVFESIQAWSRKQSLDGHWSPNGHKRAAYYFKWCIDNDIYDMEDKTKVHYWADNVVKRLPYEPYNGKVYYDKEIGFWKNKYKDII